MGKKTEKRRVEIEKEVLMSVTCDWCGDDMPVSDEWPNTRKFTLVFSEGNSYGDSGHEEGWQVEDMCDLCVRKLRVLLTAHGVSESKYLADW